MERGAIMIEVGVGISRAEETLDAADEASRLAVSRAGITRADFALVFATPHHSSQYTRMIQKVKEVTGAVHVSGCSSIGVLTNQEEIEDGPGIAVMAVQSDTLSGYSFLYHDLLKKNLTIGRSMGELVRQFRKGSELMVLFPDPYSFESSSLFNTIQEECHSSLTLIGGCASNEVNSNQTYQFSDKDVASNAISGLYLTGDFTHSVGITQSCHPVSGPLIVTRAQGKVIHELRGRPALEYLTQLIKEPDPERFSEVLEYLMIGLPVDPSDTELESGKYIVRHITGVDPSDNSIITNDEIAPGQPLTFVMRDRKRALQEFEELLDEIAQSHLSNPPRFGLYFDCAGRGISLYQSPNTDITLIRKYFGDMPLIGFFTFGEIAPINQQNYLHTFSGILTLISDPVD
jgi:small ligand-binding sensory domain FIST